MATRKNLIDTLTGLIFSHTDMDWPGSRFYAVTVTDNLDACRAATTDGDFFLACGGDIAADQVPKVRTVLAELEKISLWKNWADHRQV